jgi:hypothetical protein
MVTKPKLRTDAETARVSRSSTSTRNPRRAAASACARPTIPAPATTRSNRAMVIYCPMPSKAPAGYSGTPLAKKLGIAAGARVFASGAPDDYLELLAPLPPAVEWAKRLDPTTGIAHLFVRSRAQLGKQLAAATKAMRPDCAIWVSWPKKASGVETDVTEDVIREVALPMGLVDVKVCAVDATWSGLKLVVRKALRKG